MRLLARCLGFVLLLASASTAHASGLALHIYAADLAVERVRDPALRELLRSRQAAYRNGSVFPDTGYAINHAYGEFSHWHDFLNRYATVVQRRCPGRSLDAVCQDLVAHFLGSLSHSVADVNFDRNFITEAARRQFGGDIGEAQKHIDIGLDFLAVFDHGRGFKIAGAWAPYDALLEAYGMEPALAVSRSELERGTGIHGLAQVGETLGSPFTYWYYRWKLGWAATNYYDARGGIDDTANVIARSWDLAWAALGEGRRGDIFDSYGGWPNVDFLVDGVEIQRLRDFSHFGLMSRASGLCLDVDGARMANGSNVILWTCHGGDNQRWSYDAATGLVRSKQDPSYCLDDSGQPYDGGNVILWQCHGGVNQRFSFEADGSLRGQTNHSIVVDAYGSTPGAEVGSFTYHGGQNQRWDFVY